MEVEGKINTNTGVIMDFADIDVVWRRVGDPLDHTNLNDTLGDNATSEHLAVYLFAQLRQWLPTLRSVRVMETESGGAIVEAAQC